MFVCECYHNQHEPDTLCHVAAICVCVDLLLLFVSGVTELVSAATRSSRVGAIVGELTWNVHSRGVSYMFSLTCKQQYFHDYNYYHDTTYQLSTFTVSMQH